MKLKGKYIVQNYTNITLSDVTVVFLVGLRKSGKKEEQNSCYSLHFIVTSVNFRHCYPFLLFEIVDLINKFWNELFQPVLHLWVTGRIRIAHIFPSIHGMHCSSGLTSNTAETLCYYNIMVRRAFLLPSALEEKQAFAALLHKSGPACCLLIKWCNKVCGRGCEIVGYLVIISKICRSDIFKCKFFNSHSLQMKQVWRVGNNAEITMEV